MLTSEMSIPFLVRLCRWQQITVLLLLLSLLHSTPLTSALTARVTAAGDPTEVLDVEFPHHWATFTPHSPDTTAPLFPLSTLATSLSLPSLDELCTLPPNLTHNTTLLALLAGRALLVRRSLDTDPDKCDFATKVNNSQQLNAAAVILHNVRQADDTRHQYNDALITMTLGEADKQRYEWTIPAVFIGADSAEQLTDLWAESGGDVEVWLGEEAVSASVHAGMKRLSVVLPFAAAFASIMLFWQAMMAHWADERRQLAEVLAMEERENATQPPSTQPPTTIPDPTLAAPEAEAGSGYVRGNGSDEYTAVAVDEAESKIEDSDAVGSDGESDDEREELRALQEEEGMDALFDPPARSCSEWMSDWTERALSTLAKPRTIMAFNVLVYLVHISAAVAMLSVWPDEQCETDLQGLAALFCCRAVIGMRICYWQTHSDTPLPACGEVFVKNWCDWFLLTGGLTGSIQVWHAGQCSALAPHVLAGCQLLVLLIYAAWIARLLLWLYIGFTKLHIHVVAEEAAQQVAQQSPNPPTTSSAEPSALDGTPSLTHPLPHTTSLPHLLTLARGILDIVNGGFWWAGALDRVRPATPLDLRSLPTIVYRAGMRLTGGSGGSDGEAEQCSICFCEYESGEVLRLLYCEHVFHLPCVDEWLLRNATCPICRASVDKEKGEQQVRERRAKRARRRRRRQRRRDRQESTSVELQSLDRSALPAASSLSLNSHPNTADGMV